MPNHNSHHFILIFDPLPEHQYNFLISDPYLITLIALIPLTLLFKRHLDGTLKLPSQSIVKLFEFGRLYLPNGVIQVVHVCERNELLAGNHHIYQLFNYGVLFFQLSSIEQLYDHTNGDGFEFVELYLAVQGLGVFAEVTQAVDEDNQFQIIHIVLVIDDQLHFKRPFDQFIDYLLIFVLIMIHLIQYSDEGGLVLDLFYVFQGKSCQFMDVVLLLIGAIAVYAYVGQELLAKCRIDKFVEIKMKYVGLNVDFLRLKFTLKHVVDIIAVQRTCCQLNQAGRYSLQHLFIYLYQIQQNYTQQSKIDTHQPLFFALYQSHQCNLLMQQTMTFQMIQILLLFSLQSKTLPMQLKNKIITSRSVLTNATLHKQIQNNKIIHQLKLKQISCRKTEHQPLNLDQMLKKKLSIRNANQKIKEIFEPSQLHRKSMIGHIKEIYDRKGSTFEEIKRYKNVIKQNQQKQIMKQNRMLFEKIKDNREKMLTRKELKEQFKTYESHKSLLRKVTYESHKVKKDKKDHRSGDKLHNRTDN